MTTAIILAAGKSDRFSSSAKDKLIAPILGKPLIYYTIQSIHDHPQIQKLYIVVNQNNKKNIENIVKKYHFPKVVKIVLGGKSRQQSVENGLLAAEGNLGTTRSARSSAKNQRPAASLQTLKTHTRLLPEDIILVHNGANPFVTFEEISESIKAAKEFGAAAVGGKIVDTIKEIKDGHFIKTHDREKLIAAQTPQTFQYELLKKAQQKAKNNHKIFTDETSLVESFFKKSAKNKFSGWSRSPDGREISANRQKIKHIPASENNFKITTFQDYERAKIILGDVPQDFLVGIGQDSHGFVAPRTTAPVRTGQYLGGFFLKDCPKLEADSDGDVILHAIFNAISQAIGEGSLGRIATPLFKEKGITKSQKYLEPLLKKISARGFSLNNLGLMIEAAKPKIDQITPGIKKSLQKITGLPASRIGITATTGDKLTSFGRGEGIQVFAIVSLINNL